MLEELANLTLDEVLEYTSQKSPGKIALIEGNKTITYSMLSERVNCLANSLAAFGIKPGDTIALFLNKGIELPETFLASATCGALVAPVNFNLTINGIMDMLQEIEPKVVITHDEFLEAVQALRQHFNFTPIVAGKANLPDGYLSYEELISKGAPVRLRITSDPDTPIYLNYTSGTTGRPKGVITTHRMIGYNTISAIEALELSVNDIHLVTFAAFSHPHEFFARALYLGGSAVMLDSIYPKSISECIEKHKVTCLMAVPPILKLLTPFGKSGRYDYSTLHLVEAGGMPTPPELFTDFKRHFGIEITPVWGSTETSGIAFATPKGCYRENSAGKICPYYRFKVIDDKHDPVPLGQVGELVISGAAVVKEYFKQPKATKESIQKGWFFTGDLVTVDEDGYIYFAGRKSGMIKVSGLKVFPKEIEDVLFSHPKVEEVAVVGIDDPLKGEVPKAFVVLKETEQATAAELIDYAAKFLPHYKIPKQIEFRFNLPRIGAGKIDRKALLKPVEDQQKEARLHELKERLNRIDLHILQLLNEHFKISQGIIEFLRGNNMPLYIPEIEEELIRNILGHNSGPLHDEIIEEIFRKILSSMDFYK